MPTSHPILVAHLQNYAAGTVTASDTIANMLAAGYELSFVSSFVEDYFAQGNLTQAQVNGLRAVIQANNKAFNFVDLNGAQVVWSGRPPRTTHVFGASLPLPMFVASGSGSSVVIYQGPNPTSSIQYLQSLSFPVSINGVTYNNTPITVTVG